jgi:hypothetical protein
MSDIEELRAKLAGTTWRTEARAGIWVVEDVIVGVGSGLTLVCLYPHHKTAWRHGLTVPIQQFESDWMPEMFREISSLIYINVNEDDEAYDFWDSLEPAMEQIQEYPNDRIVICFKDTHTHNHYKENRAC